MILGLLAERGPMHGHQIRRAAELTNAEVWGGITGGAIYAELRKLNGDGLIEAIREEQVGRRPARTVYEISAEGRLELVVQRDAALQVVFGPADPVSVVLLFAAGPDGSDLAQQLAARRQRVATQLATMSAERERLTSQGVLRGAADEPWPRSAGAGCHGSKPSAVSMARGAMNDSADRAGGLARCGGRRLPRVRRCRGVPGRRAAV